MNGAASGPLADPNGHRPDRSELARAGVHPVASNYSLSLEVWQ